MNKEQELQEQFISSKPQNLIKQELQIQENPLSTKGQSRILIFYLDALDEFENRHRSTAPCLYAIVFSIFVGFIALMKSTWESQMPLLEIIYVSTLLMFVANFHLITNSDILPYINEDQLNNTVKKTAFAILGSLILFVAALQNNHPQVGVFSFLCGSLISAAFEKYYHTQTFDPQETFMGLISFAGLSFALQIPQMILLNPSAFDMKPIVYGLLSGVAMVYTGETLKQLQHQNIFTITHVIGLITIIFLPLFFPIEGLKSPALFDWLYFFIVAAAILFFLPILLKAYTMEKQSLIIHSLGWSVPVYRGMLFLFTGNFPNVFELAGMIALVVASVILLSFQRVRIHSGSFFIEKEKDDPNRPKNAAELELWNSRIGE